MESPQLTAGFERAYHDFHQGFRRQRDPVQFAHRFPDHGDKEVVAFFCALLAYGNVASILANCEQVLLSLGRQPRQAIMTGKFRCPGFVHRWTTEADLRVMAYRLGLLLRETGTLERAFMEAPGPTRNRLGALVDRLEAVPLSPELEELAASRKRNLRYLLPHPKRGSACKRLNLFLRWVVRPNDGVDLGLWKRVNPNELMLPIDVHLLRVVRQLGWTQAKQANWKVVEETTAQLMELSPHDPLRYDFALCHLSMEGLPLADYLPPEMVQ